jgi:hypothetical protein
MKCYNYDMSKFFLHWIHQNYQDFIFLHPWVLYTFFCFLYVFILSIDFLIPIIFCLIFMLILFFSQSIHFVLCTFILWIVCLPTFPWFVIICTPLLHKCFVFWLLLFLCSCYTRTLHSCDPFLYKHYVFLCCFNL